MMYRFIRIVVITFALSALAWGSYINPSNISGPLSGPGWNASAFDVVTLGVLSGNAYSEPALAGNFSTNSDTDGRVAIYGNLTNTGAPIGSLILAPYTDQYTLIVNGNSTTQNPYQVDGAAYVGGTANNALPQPTSGTVQTNPNNLDFDFTAARTALENYSVNTLTSQPNTVNLTAAPTPDPNHGNGYNINLSSYNGAVIVNLNSAYLTGSNGLYITYNTSNVTAVVFNVSGATNLTVTNQLTINGQQLSINDSSGIPILFNFPTTQSLSFNNVFTSSILAPFANFTSNSNVSGTIIVGQMGTTAETHNDYFSGTGIPAIPTSTPEPITFVLLGSGLLAIGLFRKRGR
jgi:choice-of-anchor A domain-containing protein